MWFLVPLSASGRASIDNQGLKRAQYEDKRFSRFLVLNVAGLLLRNLN